MGNFRDDIDYWTGMWDEMQEEDIIPKPSTPKISAYAADVLDVDLENDYELMQEFDSQNPIYSDSIGKDSDNNNDAWVREDLLKEIEGLKNKLFDLENELAKMGQSDKFEKKPKHKNDDSVLKKIQSVKKEIDNASDEIGLKDEPSFRFSKNK